MAKRSNTRAAHGAGNIRLRPDGRWEARYTYTDELGQPKRGSVYGATQKECRQILTARLNRIDTGSFHGPAPQRYTVEEWIDEWLNAYCINLKPMTVADYRSKAERYIIPNIGKVQLTALTPLQIQKLCNRLKTGYGEQKPLSPKSVKNIHGILHSALRRAVQTNVLDNNPADNTDLPKVRKPDLKLLMDADIGRFLRAIRGDRFETLYVVDLFSGLRQSELLGLQWNDVNFEAGELTIRRQLQKDRHGNYIYLDQTKNGKERTVSIPPSIVQLLKRQKAQQAAWKLAAGECWSNPHDLVFTNELGGHLIHDTVYRHMKRIVKQLGMESTRFHDLRHSCAILALQSGCSVKAVQEQLGHYSSAFTMDTYAAYSQTMRQDTQDRMEQAFQQAENCKGSKMGSNKDAVCKLQLYRRFSFI